MSSSQSNQETSLHDIFCCKGQRSLSLSLGLSQCSLAAAQLHGCWGGVTPHWSHTVSEGGLLSPMHQKQSLEDLTGMKFHQKTKRGDASQAKSVFFVVIDS